MAITKGLTMNIYKFHLGKVHSLEVKDDEDDEDFYVPVSDETPPLAFWGIRKFRKSRWPTTWAGAVIGRIMYFKGVEDRLDKKKLQYTKKIIALRKILNRKEVL